MKAMSTIYVVVMDKLGEDYGEEVEDILVFPDENSQTYSHMNGTTPLAFASFSEAERYREEIVKQILEEHMETEESCPVHREKGHIFLWDKAECYRITPITLVQQL